MNRLLAPDNHLIALARQGKRLPHVVLLLIVSIIATFLMQILGIIPALLVLQLVGDNGNSPLASAARGAILLIGSTSLIFAFIWAWLRWFDQRPYRTLGLETGGAVGKYARGLLVGLLMFTTAVGLAAVFGYIAFEQGDPQQQGLAALGGVLLIALGWIVQGASEEVLCRGWLLPSIGARYRPWLGVLLSALVFALLHSLNPGLSVLAMVNLFLFGIFAALYALYEGGLWGIFALHSVWNWAQGNLFGFEVSGTLPEGGILLNLQETGPDLVTGGRFGPEGGLVVSAVLLGGILVIGLLARRTSRSPVPTEA